MTICLLCRQGQLTSGFTLITFNHKDAYLSIGSVPAYVCSSCGEAYIDQTIAVRLFQIAGKLEAAGLSGESVLYSAGE